MYGTSHAPNRTRPEQWRKLKTYFFICNCTIRLGRGRPRTAQTELIYSPLRFTIFVGEMWRIFQLLLVDRLAARTSVSWPSGAHVLLRSTCRYLQLHWRLITQRAPWHIKINSKSIFFVEQLTSLMSSLEELSTRARKSFLFIRVGGGNLLITTINYWATPSN